MKRVKLKCQTFVPALVVSITQPPPPPLKIKSGGCDSILFFRDESVNETSDQF